MIITPGTRFNHYEVISLLGAGGMGEVYLAEDPRLSRQVAIKMLPAEFAKDTDRLRRFEQEARATSALNHPNILTVYDIGDHEGSPYIVAELLEGEELSELIKQGAIAQRKAVDYARQIVEGLAAAHAKGVVHRDLKPEKARGQETDHRSDIFAFGAILYEMLAGQRAFRGDSAIEVMNAILKEEPPELAEVGMKIA